MNTTDPTNQIRAAFKGVVLGNGVSLMLASVMDNFGRDLTDEPPPGADIVDDWASIPMEALDTLPNLAYLDAEGFRYYIPAYMVSVLQRYDAGSMRIIATLSALYPKPGDLWGHRVRCYDALSADQRTAIANFLSAMAGRGDLNTEDQKVVERALRNYWHAYLR